MFKIIHLRYPKLTFFFSDLGKHITICSELDGFLQDSRLVTRGWCLLTLASPLTSSGKLLWCHYFFLLGFSTAFLIDCMKFGTQRHSSNQQVQVFTCPVKPQVRRFKHQFMAPRLCMLKVLVSPWLLIFNYSIDVMLNGNVPPKTIWSTSGQHLS